MAPNRSAGFIGFPAVADQKGSKPPPPLRAQRGTGAGAVRQAQEAGGVEEAGGEWGQRRPCLNSD